MIAEVAMSMVLLAGAGLLARSFLNQISVTRGFRTDRHPDDAHVLRARPIFLTTTDEQDTLDEILSRVRVLPGVEAASSVNLLPMSGE